MTTATVLTTTVTLKLDPPVRLEQRNGKPMEARYVSIRDSDPESARGERRIGDRYFSTPIPGRHVSVTGPNIKKNGEYGELVAYRGWCVPDRHWHDGPLPEWLAAVVEALDARAATV
jgi:hypothetical protein